jgi:hypothetical protein
MSTSETTRQFLSGETAIYRHRLVRVIRQVQPGPHGRRYSIRLDASHTAVVRESELRHQDAAQS